MHYSSWLFTQQIFLALLHNDLCSVYVDVIFMCTWCLVSSRYLWPMSTLKALSLKSKVFNISCVGGFQKPSRKVGPSPYLLCPSETLIQWQLVFFSSIFFKNHVDLLQMNLAQNTTNIVLASASKMSYQPDELGVAVFFPQFGEFSALWWTQLQHPRFLRVLRTCSETHRWWETLLELSCSETCLCTCLCILMPFSYREGQHLSHLRLPEQQFSFPSLPHTKWFCKIQDLGLLYNVNMWNGLSAFQSSSMIHSTVQNKGDFVFIEPLAPFL